MQVLLEFSANFICISFKTQQIHDRGLKFGLYHDIGLRTCMDVGPGAEGHFSLDAETFANWGVDYVKLDGCFAKHMDLDTAYPQFGRALNGTGRPMVYSCSWPFYQKMVSTSCIDKTNFT